MTRTTKKLVTAALMAAFTCIATMLIKIQTPTFGYIHLGDGLVLLCGVVLGPVLTQSERFDGLHFWGLKGVLSYDR